MTINYFFVKDVKHKMGKNPVSLPPQGPSKCFCYFSMYLENYSRKMFFNQSLHV